MGRQFFIFCGIVIWSLILTGCAKQTVLEEEKTRLEDERYYSEAAFVPVYSAEEWLSADGALIIPFDPLYDIDTEKDYFASYQIPQEVMDQASTEALLSVVEGKLSPTDSAASFLQLYSGSFNAINECLGREDLAETVLASYQSDQFVKDIYGDDGEILIRIREYLRKRNGIVLKEVILATDLAFDQMDDEMRMEVLEAVEEKQRLREAEVFECALINGFYSYIGESVWMYDWGETGDGCGSKWYDYIVNQVPDNEEILEHIAHYREEWRGADWKEQEMQAEERAEISDQRTRLEDEPYYSEYWKEIAPIPVYPAEKWLSADGELVIPFDPLYDVYTEEDYFASYQIPQEVMDQASTEALLSVVVGKLEPTNSATWFLQLYSGRFNVINECLRREDLAETVLASYQSDQFMMGVYRNDEEDATRFREYKRKESGIILKEIILATDLAFDQMDDEMRMEVLEAVEEKQRIRETGVFECSLTNGFYAYIGESMWTDDKGEIGNGHGSKWYDYIANQVPDNEEILEHIKHFQEEWLGIDWKEPDAAES